MAALANVPDLDVFFHWCGPWSYWLQHRGISHSFFGAVVQSCFFAAVLSRFDPGPFRQRWFHYSLPFFLHSVCDYLTSYGVPLFSPFTFEEYGANLVPAVTVIPLLFMGVGLWFVHRRKTEGWAATRWMWVSWGLYLVLSISSRAYANHLVGRNGEGEKTEIVAGVINPFGWTAVTDIPPCCAYSSRHINLLTGKEKKGVTAWTDMDSFPIKASLTSDNIRRFSKTTHWAVGRAVPLPEGGWRVDWGKIIFSSRGMVRSLWSLNVSSSGVVSGEERSVNFWDPDDKAY